MSRTALILAAASCLLAALAACSPGPATVPTGAAPLVRGDEAALAELAAALEHLASGRRQAALEALDACLAAHPTSHEAHLEYARLAATTGSTAPALAIYQQLFEQDPTDHGVARGLARLSLFLGRADLAAEAAEALATAGASAGDLALAAEVALTTGDAPLARARAEAAVAQDPRQPAGHLQLALAMLEGGAGDDPTATGPIQAALRRAIQNDPGRTEARYLLGTLMMQAGNEVPGQELLDSTALVDELRGAAFDAMAPEQRIQRARAIGRELEGWSQPTIEVARAQLALGRPVKAEASLAEAMQLKPRSLELYKLRYAAAIARGDEKAERNWLERWNKKRGEDG